MVGRQQRSRHGPLYLRMLIAIVVSYAVVIAFTHSAAGAPGRILVLGYLLQLALRQVGRPAAGLWVWVGTIVAVLVESWFGFAGSQDVASALVGGVSFLVAVTVIATIAKQLISVPRMDLSAVLGVLCIYLLLALLFASLNQFLSVFQPHYLNGVTGPPTASDFLYFSVITMATVGFGDITPATQIARAVTVVEALVGQLYLVSVVATVVGSFQPRNGRPRRSDTTGDDEP